MVPFLLQFEMLQGSLCLVGLVFLGIPHGGNDFFYRKEKNTSGSVKFLLMYLGIMLLYLALWYVWPMLSLALFLLISIHHFGQSNFNTHRMMSLDSVLWGSWLVVFPVLKHSQEVFGIFATMLDRPGAIVSGFGHLNDSGLLVVSIVFVLMYGAVLYRTHRSGWMSYLLQWFLVTVWYWLTPLLLGFVVVFCFWHALQSMQYQLDYVRVNYNQNRKKTLMGFVPFGLMALVGMAFLLRFDLESNLGFAFVLLSLVTLPHVVVMDGLYRNQKHD
ncbi:MAG: Brp/Blh family beta-carotene 15,15'-dioxygenase [Bacteroidetes bacterium]|nr:Brp/Blh family beta-carotene 15,15'-dioxygenase [Bacteroidota bacterium]MDA1223811.1 Brp/Blh family beta-carotene 15,15'-dioxygenase [Bacteroidota bacterium]